MRNVKNYVWNGRDIRFNPFFPYLFYLFKKDVFFFLFHWKNKNDQILFLLTYSNENNSI